MFVLGDVPVSAVLYLPFDTYDSNGASVTITGLAVTDIEIYKNGSTTQRASDNGYTLLDTDGIDFDGVTGLHGFSVDLGDNSDSGFYAAGSEYWINVNAITVDSQTVRFTFYFTIGRLLRPATAGRTAVVDASGLIDANTVKVGPTGSGVAQTAGDILARTPVTEISHGVTTQIRCVSKQSSGSTCYFVVVAQNNQRWNDTLGAAENYNAANWTDYDLSLSEQGSSGLFVGTFPGSISSGEYYWVIAYRRIGGSPAVSDPVIGLSQVMYWSGAALSDGVNLVAWNGSAPANLDGSGRVTALTAAVSSNAINAAAIAAGAIDAATFAADVDAEARGWLGLGSANLDTQLGDIPTNAELTTALGTSDDAVLAQVALVKAKTDQLVFTEPNQLDVNVQSINDVPILGDGSGTPFHV